MYETAWQSNLYYLLENADIGNDDGEWATILQAEMALWLLETLGILENEPAIVIWNLMAGLPLPGIRRLLEDSDKRYLLAKARIILRYAGLSRWEETLEEYKLLDLDWRCYDFENISSPAYKTGNHGQRLLAYQAFLHQEMEFKKRDNPLASAGEVAFSYRDQEGELKTISLTLPNELVDYSSKTPLPKLDERIHNESTWEVDFKQLYKLAQSVERREIELGLEPQNWLDRVSKVQFRTLGPNNLLNSIPDEKINITGVTHLAGMVGSGKSTLMQLLALQAVLERKRITLVVQDTMMAFALADYFNRIEGRLVAVAIFGRTTRGQHLQRLYQSDAHDRGEDTHVGFRWLNQACPLQGLVSPLELPLPLPFGKEPCSNLKVKIEKRGKEREETRLCPLFSICPSQKLYYDMQSAYIWITTPGALGAASIPDHVDNRPIKLGEIIYEQSQVVIFDEVDVIQEWFDALYAPELPLIGKNDSFFDIADLDVAEKRILQARNNPELWSQAIRNADDMAHRVVQRIESEANDLIEVSVKDSFITSQRLFAHLARSSVRLSEISDVNSNDYKEREKRSKELEEIFKLMGKINLFTLSSFPRPDESVVTSLARVLSAVIREGAVLPSRQILADCRAWIAAVVFQNDEKQILKFDHEAEIRAKEIEAGSKSLSRPPKHLDTLDQLALRLEFALSIEALDQNIRIVFNRLYASSEYVPENLAQYFTRHVPRELTGFMPAPAPGRLFGFRYQKEERINKAQLSALDYANIGRWYTLQFSNLRSDIDGMLGPHVLALSGTSWMPDAIGLHFAQTPTAVLEPNESSKNAIRQSHFEFLPMRDSKKRPIFVSGSGKNLLDNLGEIGKKLVDSEHNWLNDELQMLRDLGTSQPDLWEDRERILIFVNSYDQVQVVAKNLVTSYPMLANQISGLARSNEMDGANLWVDPLLRGDVEHFRNLSEKKILIAPLMAVGRAYNILNSKGKAGFGSVFFLTRPMPQPFDMQRMVRASNRKALELCNDPDFFSGLSSIYEQGAALRKEASEYWSRISYSQRSYKALEEDEIAELAATSAGLLIQAIGRLLRGNVPFRAFFVDAAWAENNARDLSADTSNSSLLVAIIYQLHHYIYEHTERAIGEALYEPLYQAIKDIKYRQASSGLLNYLPPKD